MASIYPAGVDTVFGHGEVKLAIPRVAVDCTDSPILRLAMDSIMSASAGRPQDSQLDAMRLAAAIAMNGIAAIPTATNASRQEEVTHDCKCQAISCAPPRGARSKWAVD